MRAVRVVCGICIVAMIGLRLSAQAAPAMPYDHVHLSVPDPDKAYAWYAANLGGQQGETPGRVIFEPFTNTRPEPVQLLFNKVADAQPSDGSVIDSIGFSVPDVRATMRALVAAGATMTDQAHVIDPSGVKLELVDDARQRGFHHVTLRVADPAATLGWFATNVGGARVKMLGRDALQYGRTYLVVTQGSGASSQGRAIDHLGFAPANIDRATADLRARGVKITGEPIARPNQFGHRNGFVEAPGGIRIELVEHSTCEWGKVPDAQAVR